MDSFSQMQIFFIISSIGFIIVFVLVVTLLYYVIGSVYTFKRIIDKVEKNIDRVGDATKYLLEDVRDSTVFNFLFKKKRKSRKE